MFDHVEKIVFEPVVPKLSVWRVDSVSVLKELADFMRNVPDLFIQFDQRTIKSMRVRDGSAFVPAGVMGHDDDYVLVKVGSWVVESENGVRYLTDSAIVRHGAFADFPAELFIPIEGTRVN